MGTNFYWIVKDGRTPLGVEVVEDADDDSWRDDEPQIHLGKRSAAGWYCWDCRVTLCAEGEAAIHMGHSHMLDRCPRCGKGREEDGYNAAKVELGFAGPPADIPRGVQGASSFSWAQDQDAALVCCAAHPDEEIVVDEYGRAYTGAAFLDLLATSCPIRFTHSIGRYFS